MRNAKSRLLILLCSLLTVGIGLATADFQINVGPQDYFGTLNLNKLILRKGQNPGYTGIVIDGDSYSIKINENGNEGYGEIRVEKVCDRNGDCKSVSQLSTGAAQGINVVSNTSGGTQNYSGQSPTSFIYINHVENGAVTSYIKLNAGNNNTTLSANRGTINISSTDNDTHYTGTLTIKGSGTQAVQFDQQNNSTLNIVGSGNTRITVSTSANNGTITIYSTGGGGGGGGDSLWTGYTSSSDESAIKPTESVNIYLSKTDSSILYNNSLTIEKDGTNATPTSKITFDGKGLRIGNSSYTGAGMGINGGSLVVGKLGCDDNRISIFASGNSSNNANYEILGSQRLVIGAYNSSYMLFTTNNSIGINTAEDNINSTLTVNGGIKISNCGINNTCRAEIAGEIKYIETTNTGYFIGCVKMQGNAKKNNINAKNYARIKLTDGTKHETQITNSSDCNLGIPYNIDNYSTMIPQGACSS